jgi:hypothetical protein
MARLAALALLLLAAAPSWVSGALLPSGAVAEPLSTEPALEEVKTVPAPTGDGDVCSAAAFTETKELQAAVELWNENKQAALSLYGHISDWDVRKITDMKGLFCAFDAAAAAEAEAEAARVKAEEEAAEVAEEPQHDNDEDSAPFCNGTQEFNEDISRWNTSKVVDMSSMFAFASSFNANLSAWDVSSVESMEFMFTCASSFNANLSAWDVSNVKLMHDMFAGATSFKQQLGGRWATSTAGKGFMFDECPGSIVGVENFAGTGTPLMENERLYDMMKQFNEIEKEEGNTVLDRRDDDERIPAELSPAEQAELKAAFGFVVVLLVLLILVVLLVLLVLLLWCCCCRRHRRDDGNL